MKTFTVTFHHTCNYGALFQCYSLQTTLKNLGHENTVMEYPDKDRFYGRISKSPKQAVRGLYRNWLRFLRKKPLQALQASFRTFHKNRLNLSKVYATWTNCVKIRLRRIVTSPAATKSGR